MREGAPVLRKRVSVWTVLNTTVRPKNTLNSFIFYLRLPQEITSLSSVYYSFLIISINVYGGH